MVPEYPPTARYVPDGVAPATQHQQRNAKALHKLHTLPVEHTHTYGLTYTHVWFNSHTLMGLTFVMRACWIIGFMEFNATGRLVVWPPAPCTRRAGCRPACWLSAIAVWLCINGSKSLCIKASAKCTCYRHIMRCLSLREVCVIRWRRHLTRVLVYWGWSSPVDHSPENRLHTGRKRWHSIRLLKELIINS